MSAGRFKLNDLSAPHAALIDAMKGQLLIVLVRRLGGKLTIPVAEVDDTSGVNLLFAVDQEARTFTFEVVDK